MLTVHYFVRLVEGKCLTSTFPKEPAATVATVFINKLLPRGFCHRFHHCLQNINYKQFSHSAGAAPEAHVTSSCVNNKQFNHSAGAAPETHVTSSCVNNKQLSHSAGAAPETHVTSSCVNNKQFSHSAGAAPETHVTSSCVNNKQFVRWYAKTTMIPRLMKTLL